MIAAVVLSATAAFAAPVEVHIPVPPTVMLGSDGHAHLAYELHVTNFYRNTGALWLERVAVFDHGRPSPLVDYSGAALEDRLVHPGETPAERRSISGGMRAIVYIWVSLQPDQPAPRLLRHRLVFAREKGGEETVDGVETPVQTAGALVLSAPLRQGLWLAHEGPGNHRAHHWGSQLASNGRATVPQRFAIDYIGLDAGWRAVRGDFRESSNEDWAGFGAEVLSVADGIARDVRDGAVDNKPLAPLASPGESLHSLYGNYVVLEMGPGSSVHYAHLQLGSVSLKAGQRVRRGAVIGRVGNSGNSSAPHLHLHVSDRPQFTDSEGLPLVHESFDVLGETTAARAIGAEPGLPPPGSGPINRRRAIPLHGAVVRFR